MDSDQVEPEKKRNHANVGRHATLDAAIRVIFKISYIDHDIEEYIAAMIVPSGSAASDEERIRQIWHIRSMTHKRRIVLYKKYLRLLYNHNDLRTIRQKRNTIAHCVDTVTDSGVSGQYVPEINYDKADLDRTLDAANHFIALLKKQFMTNPNYKKWQSRRVSTDAYEID